MLDQHPVPQNVTTFQFRLIGDMTLKQFGYLAGGAVLAYIGYSLPLPFFFTWPLAALFGLGGIGFAFVPVEQRPMDVWFLSFIRSVYSPTLYIWQREPATQPVQQTVPALPSLPTMPAIPSKATPKNIWATFFAKKKQKTIVNPLKMESHAVVTKEEPVVPTAPPPPPQPVVPVTPPVVQPSPPPPPIEQKKEEEPSVEQKLQTALDDKKKLEEELASIRQMLLSQQNPQPATPAVPVAEKKPVTPQPAFRSYPNVITGTVRLQTGELLHSILVTVKDKDDIPLRALKTNKMGQFAASTPLPNGTYIVDVEDPKGVFSFQPIKINLEGKVVDPLIVVARSKQDLERQKLADALFGKKD